MKYLSITIGPLMYVRMNDTNSGVASHRINSIIWFLCEIFNICNNPYTKKPVYKSRLRILQPPILKNMIPKNCTVGGNPKDIAPPDSNIWDRRLWSCGINNKKMTIILYAKCDSVILFTLMAMFCSLVPNLALNIKMQRKIK